MIDGQERSSGSRSLRSHHMRDFQLVPMICAASILRCPCSRRRCMRYAPSVPGSGVSARGFGARKEAVTPGIKMATRLCRCGVGGPGRGHCGKAPRCQMSYQSRVSGPLLDRIDLTVDVPPVTAADLALPPPAEGTAEVAARVAAAREVQSDRAKKAGGGVAALNARAEGEWLETIAALDPPARALLTRAAEAGALSARGWSRTLRLARTIADLEGAAAVRRVHIAEALIYRRIAPAAESFDDSRASSYSL
jgi:hypothetical protein